MFKYFNIISKPIPFLYDTEVTNRIIIVVCLFPPLFIVIFNPFSIISANQGFLVYLAVLGFGLVSAIVSYLFLILIPILFKRIFDQFTVGKAIIFYLAFLVTLTAGNFLYKNALEGFETFHFQEFVKILKRTILIAVIPVSLILFWVYNYQLKKNLKTALLLNNKLNKKNSQEEILIRSENNKEFLKIPYNDLLYIENADNYVFVFFVKNQKCLKKIIRTTLKDIESKIENPTIMRCHRSFIVNLNKIQHLSGNSRGLFITLLGTEAKIPVSRKYVKRISDVLQLK